MMGTMADMQFPDPAQFAPSSGEPDNSALMDQIVTALKTVFDPEIPVDIYELGLIYDVKVNGPKLFVTMTLTAPGCPVAGEMPLMVERALMGVEGVEEVDVDLVWDPPWDPSRMSESARLELGMD
jgi:FeS assembly SUF system protein